MGVRLDRRALIARGKRDKALAFAAEVAAYVTEKWVPVTWGVEMGGTNGAIHWFADYANLSQMEETMMASMADEEYGELIDKAAKYFEPGIEDTLTITM